MYWQWLPTLDYPHRSIWHIYRENHQNKALSFSSGQSVTVTPWAVCHNQGRWPSVHLVLGESLLTVATSENLDLTLAALRTTHSDTLWTHCLMHLRKKKGKSLSDCQMRRGALKITLYLITLFYFKITHPFLSAFLSLQTVCAEMGRWSVSQRKKVTSLHNPLLSVPAPVLSNNKVLFQAMSCLLKSRALCLQL